MLCYPSPPCPNTGQVLVQGAKVRKHTGSPCLDKPVLPRSTFAHNVNGPLTSCRGSQNLSGHKLIVRVPLVCDRQPGSEKRIVHDNKRVSNRLAYTPEHKSTWYYNYTNTLTPMLTLPAACTKLQTTFSSPKAQKPNSAEGGVIVFGQAHIRTKGGGDTFSGK